jgi:AP-1 complex subunit beta-1
VKLEKIDIMVKVADEKNADIILSELKDNAYDMEIELVRKSVKAIGQIILKIDKASKKAVEIVTDIVNNGQQAAL